MASGALQISRYSRTLSTPRELRAYVEAQGPRSESLDHRRWVALRAIGTCSAEKTAWRVTCRTRRPVLVPHLPSKLMANSKIAKQSRRLLNQNRRFAVHYSDQLA